VSLEAISPESNARGHRSTGARLPSRIGINAVFLMPGMGGLDTYMQELVPALLGLAPEVRFSIFCTAVGERHLRRLDWAEEVEFVTHPLLGPRGLKAFTELTVLGALASRRVDLLHNVAFTAPLWTRAVNVVMIADVTWILETQPDPSMRLWRLIVPPLARRADRVIAISNAGAEHIERYLRVPRDRIDVTLLGYARHGTIQPVPDRQLRGQLSLPDGPIVLSVASRRPHKNLLRLVAALPMVLEARPDTILVLCGNPTAHDVELRAEASRLGLDDRVILLPFVEPAVLEGLYAAAACFVMSSLNEGFGLPVIEAMGRGVPVACSNVSAMPEVAAGGARLFDPLDVGDIGRAIVEILTDTELAARLIEAGTRQAASLTWERTAERTLECYERAWRDRA
jgi:glycosyltransferase involved in cell wall biosynthesis